MYFKLDKKVFIYASFAGLLPVMFFFFHGLVTGKEFKPLLFVINSLSSILITNTATISVNFTLHYVNIHFPWNKNPIKRVVVELIFSNIAVAIVMTLCFWAAKKIMCGDVCFVKMREDWFQLLVIGVIMNTILTSIGECIYFFQMWRESLLRAERLEREKAQSQYEMLKQQVNPHFLFNSLNVLSSLIHIDTDKAERFINEFSHVYRYILEISNKSLVSLREELQIAHSYLYLQQIRFSDGLQVDFSIAESALQKQLPPMALQLLLENAIKHNIVSREHPLHVRISVENDYLIVTNNFQLRNEHVESTGKGLPNLSQRIQLISGKQVEFGKIGAQFMVKVPLIT